MIRPREPADYDPAVEGLLFGGLDELAGELRPDLKVDGRPVNARLRQGKVEAVNAGPSSVDVRVAGTLIPGVRHLDSYSPTVDDTVWLVQQGSLRLVLGKLAS